MNRAMLQDLSTVAIAPSVAWAALDNTRVLVTGANGLIGKTIVQSLLQRNHIVGCNTHVVAQTRNIERARQLFSGWEEKNITYICGDIQNPVEYDGGAEYVIHCASPTASQYFVENPVETIQTIVRGTSNVLEWAKQSCVRSVLFLSSMEVYGSVDSSVQSVGEATMGYINPLATRSSYPQAKRMAETLCAAYAQEYNLPVKIIRLAQTFGTGVTPDDTRVFAQFARAALKGEDICLDTDGSSKRMYLDTMDAVRAVLIALLNGENGKAYNAANESTYCSVKDMASLVSERIANVPIHVQHAGSLAKRAQYPPPHFLPLDTSALAALGWQPERGLVEMYQQMIACWKEQG